MSKTTAAPKAARHRQNSREQAKKQRARLRAAAPTMPDDEKRKHVKARLLYHAKWRAKRDGVPFNLTLEDLTFGTHCPLLGTPFVLHFYSKFTKGPDLFAPSLDRLDPTKGYVKGNVTVISHRANSIKRDATLQELSTLVENLRVLIENSEGA